MPLDLIMGIGRAFRRKRTASLDILSPKRAPRNFYKGKNCKPTGFHTRKGGYVVVQDKLPNYVVPDLTDFKLKPHVSKGSRLQRQPNQLNKQMSGYKTSGSVQCRRSCLEV